LAAVMVSAKLTIGKEKAGKFASEGKTPLFIAVDSELAGIIAVADQIKGSSLKTVEKLHSLGLEVVMLTGDNRKTAQVIAEQLSIDKVVSEVLPEDKAKNSLIEELKQYLIYRQDLDKGEKFAPFMKQILQVIDRIESSEEKSDLLTSIAEELLQILSLNGLQVIDNSGMIDPSMHEVVNTVAVTDEQSENNIVEVLQKGYLLNNRVLRPSKVTIAK